MAERVDCSRLYQELHREGRHGVVRNLYQAMQPDGLPNEVDWAFRCLAVIAYDGAYLSKLPNMLDLIMAHVQHFTLSSEMGNLLTVGPPPASAGVDKSARAGALHRIFGAAPLVGATREERGELEVYGLRLVQISRILYNLSCEPTNQALMGKNPLVQRFVCRSLAAANAQHFIEPYRPSRMAMVFEHRLTLHARGLELLHNLGPYLELDVVPRAPAFVFHHLTESALHSDDRASTIGALGSIGRLCFISSNRKLLFKLGAEAMQRIATLLLVPDVSIILPALEVTYQLASHKESARLLVEHCPHLLSTLVRLLDFDLDWLADSSCTEPEQATLPMVESFSDLTQDAKTWLRRAFAPISDQSRRVPLAELYKQYLAHRGKRCVLSQQLLSGVVKAVFGVEVSKAKGDLQHLFFLGLCPVSIGHTPIVIGEVDHSDHVFRHTKRRRVEDANQAAKTAMAMAVAGLHKLPPGLEPAAPISAPTVITLPAPTAQQPALVAPSPVHSLAVVSGVGAALPATPPRVASPAPARTPRPAPFTLQSATTLQMSQYESGPDVGGDGLYLCPNAGECSKKYKNLNGLSYHLATSSCAGRAALKARRVPMTASAVAATDWDFLKMIYDPFIIPGFVHLCEWNNCGKGLPTRGELISHIGHAHIGTMQEFPDGCLWGGCTKVGRLKRAGLISHMHTHFCRARIVPEDRSHIQAEEDESSKQSAAAAQQAGASEAAAAATQVSVTTSIPAPQAPLQTSYAATPVATPMAAAGAHQQAAQTQQHYQQQQQQQQQPTPRPPIFIRHRDEDPWSGYPWVEQPSMDHLSVHGVRFGAALTLRSLAQQPAVVHLLKPHETEIALKAMADRASAAVLAGCLADVAACE